MDINSIDFTLLCLKFFKNIKYSTNLNFIKRIYLIMKKNLIIIHENLSLRQAENINRSLCLSVDKNRHCRIFSIMQKNWIYLARHRRRGRSESRAEIVRIPLSFCFTHSRVKSKGGRTEHGRGEGRTRTQDEERFTGEHPTSALVATHRGIHIRGRSSSTTPRLAALASALAAILHFTLALRFGR